VSKVVSVVFVSSAAWRVHRRRPLWEESQQSGRGDEGEAKVEGKAEGRLSGAQHFNPPDASRSSSTATAAVRVAMVRVCVCVCVSVCFGRGGGGNQGGQYPGNGKQTGESLLSRTSQ